MPNVKTTKPYWNGIYESVGSHPGLPSSFSVGNRCIKRILLENVRPGQTVLEIGCAPGKWLAWLARATDAKVAGLDYSPEGVKIAHSLFEKLGIVGDLRCEDAFNSSFAKARFDVVFSLGVIEHFDDPSEIVRIHLDLTRPGGISIITIPNYTGLYATLQRYFYPENLTIHNLSIMNKDALERLIPRDVVHDVRVFKAGRFNPGLISVHRRWPKLASRLITHSLNILGHCQPMRISFLCPLWVLLMQRRS